MRTLLMYVCGYCSDSTELGTHRQGFTAKFATGFGFRNMYINTGAGGQK